MRFRNAFQLLMENFKNVARVLGYKLVVGVICTALYAALILPELNEIFSSAEWTALFDDLKLLVGAFVPGAEFGSFEALRDNVINGSLPAFGQMVSEKLGSIIGRAIGCVVIYLVQRFADTMCYFSVGSILNDKMSTYVETPFSRAYISNLEKSAKYSLVYVPIAFAFDVAIAIVCVLTFVFTNVGLALFLSATVIAMGQALKLTVTSAWMPAMTADDMKLSQAMKAFTKEEKKRHRKMFIVYLAMVYIIVVANVLAVTCTLSSGLIITVPASYVLLVCAQYVNYYTIKGKKYFVTFDAIQNNTCKGDTEHVFQYVEETGETEE